MVIGIGLTLLVSLVRDRLARGRLPEQISDRQSGSPFAVALSIGIVPCPVTSVLFIFSLTLGLVWQGILLVIAFAAGMGLSLAAVACLMWSIKETITLRKFSAFHYLLTNVFPAAGGILLISIGTAMLYSFL